MKLIERLQFIADRINKGETVADIGTDHGFLPLYLLKTKKSPKVIMADVSEGSLKKAEENCKLFKAEGDYDLRLGSGLDVLQKGETDVVVIAGMGGQLIRDILDSDKEKTYTFKKLILQPRNKAGLLRNWLYNNGYEIIEDGLVKEGRFICEIVVAEFNGNFQNIPYTVETDYPNTLLKNEKKILKDYILYKLSFEEGLFKELLKGNNVPEEKLLNAKNKVARLNHLLNQVNSEEIQ